MLALYLEAGNETGQLRPDAPHQFCDCAVVHAVQLQLALDGDAQLGVGHRQLLVCVFGDDALQELLQSLRHLPLDDGGRGG